MPFTRANPRETPNLARVKSGVVEGHAWVQGSVLRIWGGKEENRAKAQEMGLALASVNADASLGFYQGRPHPST